MVSVLELLVGICTVCTKHVECYLDLRLQQTTNASDAGSLKSIFESENFQFSKFGDTYCNSSTLKGTLFPSSVDTLRSVEEINLNIFKVIFLFINFTLSRLTKNTKMKKMIEPQRLLIRHLMKSKYQIHKMTIS